MGLELLTRLARRELRAEATFQRLGLKPWERAWLRRVLRLNFGARQQSATAERTIVRSLAEEFDLLRQRQARRRSKLPTDQKAFKGNRAHLGLLARSLDSPAEYNEWNDWRKKHPRTRPDLRGANLGGLDLNDVRLDHTLLEGADLSDCNLVNANLVGADLRRVRLFDASLTFADLRESHLEAAWLQDTNLTDAKLQGAHLGGSLLIACNLNMAHLEGADLQGAFVWGCSYWGVRLDATTQQAGIRIGWGDFDWIDLLVANDDRDPFVGPKMPEFEVKIQDLRVADFVWQISENPERVAQMINAASSRLVLLLGRFRGKQKKVLRDILSPTLGEMGYVPMVFDFEAPEGRDVIESVSILAGLSRFVVADLTSPRSTPLESQLVVPTLAVPFVPIIRKGEDAFSMFAALQHKYSWVRPLVVYKTDAELRRRLKTEIVPDAERVAEELRLIKSGRQRPDGSIRHGTESARIQSARRRGTASA